MCGQVCSCCQLLLAGFGLLCHLDLNQACTRLEPTYTWFFRCPLYVYGDTDVMLVTIPELLLPIILFTLQTSTLGFCWFPLFPSSCTSLNLQSLSTCIFCFTCYLRLLYLLCSLILFSLTHVHIISVLIWIIAHLISTIIALAHESLGLLSDGQSRKWRHQTSKCSQHQGGQRQTARSCRQIS